MKVIIENSLGELLISSIKEVLKNGILSSPRGIKTIEISPLTLILSNPRNRFIQLKTINYPLIVIKQIYSLIGKVNMEAFDFYEKSFNASKNSAAYLYSDLLHSNIHKQLLQSYNLLTKDPLSRQAVLKIGLSKKDEVTNPITISIQFIYRASKLNMIAHLRSNELWKGLATDLHFIIFLQEVLAAWLKVEIGTYTHIIGSAHIYDENLPFAEEFISNTYQQEESNSALFKGNYNDSIYEAKKFVNYDIELRKKQILSKCKFDNPYFNFCSKIVEQVFIEASNNKSG